MRLSVRKQSRLGIRIVSVGAGIHSVGDRFCRLGPQPNNKILERKQIEKNVENFIFRSSFQKYVFVESTAIFAPGAPYRGRVPQKDFRPFSGLWGGLGPVFGL